MGVGESGALRQAHNSRGEDGGPERRSEGHRHDDPAVWNFELPPGPREWCVNRRDQSRKANAGSYFEGRNIFSRKAGVAQQRPD